MKMKSNCICVVALTALLGGCTSETKTAEAPPAASKAAAELPSRAGPDMAPLTAEDSVLVSVTATVQAINLPKRELTLKGPLGNVNSFTVDKQVKRLDEVKVGDEVTVDYFVSVAGELRAPTEEERRNPISIVEGMARGPKGSDPAGGGVRTVRVVAEVIGLDMPSQTVTLKGPKGDWATVRAKKPENFKKLRLGDTIVVTYTEALAISVEKVSHPKAN
jgi:hypothetical protein